VHLGWVPLVRHHERFLQRLPEAVDDSELVVLNGDIVDHHRGLPSTTVRDLVARLAELVASWRQEGRQVVYVEGNHDSIARAVGPLRPETWCHDFEGARGERVRVIHGHKLSRQDPQQSRYESWGKHFLRLENHLYARSRTLRRLYPASIGWLVGAVGLTEDRVWRPGFNQAVARWQAPMDVLVHGHFHFGPGSLRLGPLRLHRSGAWVSRGHRGSVDRLLRYQDGRFHRLALRRERWLSANDGR